MGWSTSIISPPDGDMGDYMRSLEKLLIRDDEVYYPAHGPEIRNPKEMVSAFIEHRKEREEKILGCLKAGIETIHEMVPVVYSDISEELYDAAARSLFATIIYLVEQNNAVSLGTIAENGRFRLAG
jgi:glyoxylase-like metal-dependent hydrolase (beta-lactamase superfamily II)